MQVDAVGQFIPDVDFGDGVDQFIPRVTERRDGFDEIRAKRMGERPVEAELVITGDDDFMFVRKFFWKVKILDEKCTWYKPVQDLG